MSLYAAGLNAWSQLDFDTTKKDQQPDDIFTFTCLLEDKDIDYIRPFPSYTQVYTTTTPFSPTYTAGLVPKLHQQLSTSHPDHYHHFAEASNDIVVVPNHPTNPHPLQYPSLTTLLSPSSQPISEKDIKDVAVGQSHVLVLTTDDEIWGRGDNSSGQLGLGRETKLVTEWTRLKGEFDHDKKKIKGVWAGERNSFVVVQP
ncbi:uncharacterized protein PODANS_3_7960 [Podospora anserina S mat+]|uniref:Podospora anserina S mat+ genomic DNA chromosome 3, supercontig 2 n=1 Tax=Podospora anserina (strain S / ATCC MYA-4624 / DSM 980 / FGSC 10383) TaxID=515849 RepID=B2B109_PODAN|nr:uncharacterized protein PODANS_3_7960 [Podospora anserina S mat+]CAP70734.1 unnamed protein product [Podospora anserina S mat+]